MTESTRRAVVRGLPAVATSTAIATSAKAKTAGVQSAGPLRVASAEDRRGRPLQIKGQDFVCTKISGADVDGRYTTVVLSTPPGRGPALHIHNAQNEWFFVLEGKIGLLCGQAKTVLGPGDSFLAPLGVPHAYVTLGTQTARMMNLFDPAGDVEAYFRACADVLNAPGPPDHGRLDALSDRYGMKVVGPPLHATEFVA